MVCACVSCLAGCDIRREANANLTRSHWRYKKNDMGQIITHSHFKLNIYCSYTLIGQCVLSVSPKGFWIIEE